MAQLNILGNTLFSLGSPIEPIVPFRATGGTVETFVTGGVSYTMHSFTNPGTSSFEILQGSSSIDILVIGGGGCGNGPTTGVPGTVGIGGVGGGGGGVILSSSVYVKKDPRYGIVSAFDACVGSGGVAETFGNDICLLNSTGSSFIKKYDERGYYAPDVQIYTFGGGNGYAGSGSSGAGGGGLALTGGQGQNGGGGEYSGGGGYSQNGGVATGGSTSGFGGTGFQAPYYFGGASGSYPVLVAGGGPGGGLWDDTFSPVLDYIPYTGSFGAGDGGGYAAGFNPPTQAQASGSNGVSNTGGAGAGGAKVRNGASIYNGPGGNGGSGVVRVIYVTQP
jgi:hypothetical protein